MIHIGDCRDVLDGVEPDSVDSIVTDPPYGYGFMGKDWDRGVPGVPFWKRAWKVLKPGGYLLAFGGARTYHWLAAAIEDAGFEIRDQILWIYGSGFPKSLDISKAIDKAAGVERSVIVEGTPVKRIVPGAEQNRKGSWIKDNGRVYVPTVTLPATEAAKEWEGWGTALKPAHEPIVVARKPLMGTVAENVLAHGVGGINIDGSRVPGAKPDTTRGAGGQHGRYSELGAQGRILDDGKGRWPANVIHDGSEEVLEEFAKYGEKGAFAPVRGTEPSSATKAVFGQINRKASNAFHGDKGTAARFFYCAKASRKERASSKHPTVKPLALIRYLVRLVTPRGG